MSMESGFEDLVHNSDYFISSILHNFDWALYLLMWKQLLLKFM